jgi:hypothetical protein
LFLAPAAVKPRIVAAAKNSRILPLDGNLG